MNRFIFLCLITSLWGCTEEKSSSVQKYQISFSEELSLDFGKVGMSSQVPFSISPRDEKNESFLIFNTFYRRLDTVSFSKENKRIVSGVEVPREGPQGIPSFDLFTFTPLHGVIFFNGNNIFYFKNDNTVKLNMTNELDNGSGSTKSINGADRRNGTFQGYSSAGDFISVIINDNETGQFYLIKYDIDSGTFNDLNFLFDLDQMSNHDFSFKKGSITIKNTYSPFLTVSDSEIIISYPFFNKISKVGLKDMKQSDILYDSKLFKTQKDLPSKIGDSDYEEFSEEFAKWNNDIYYASIFRLNDSLMYRMVFENIVSQKVYLELFNNSLEKVGEFDLKAIEPDLKFFHLTVEGKILIQSSKDPDEDTFKYYLISVDEILI